MIIYFLLGVILHHLGLLKGWLLVIYILGCLECFTDFINKVKEDTKK